MTLEEIKEKLKTGYAFGAYYAECIFLLELLEEKQKKINDLEKKLMEKENE